MELRGRGPHAARGRGQPLVARARTCRSCRWSRRWWSRSRTTTWRATASGTPRSSAAGARTATRESCTYAQLEEPVTLRPRRTCCRPADVPQVAHGLSPGLSRVGRVAWSSVATTEVAPRRPGPWTSITANETAAAPVPTDRASTPAAPRRARRRPTLVASPPSRRAPRPRDRRGGRRARPRPRWPAAVTAGALAAAHASTPPTARRRARRARRSSRRRSTPPSASYGSDPARRPSPTPRQSAATAATADQQVGVVTIDTVLGYQGARRRRHRHDPHVGRPGPHQQPRGRGLDVDPGHRSRRRARPTPRRSSAPTPPTTSPLLQLQDATRPDPGRRSTTTTA